jgi:hypothetical protein
VKAARTTRSAKRSRRDRLGSELPLSGPTPGRLACRRDISIASATTLPLFEDHSVENRPQTFYRPSPSVRFVRFSSPLILYHTFAFATAPRHLDFLRSQHCLIFNEAIPRHPQQPWVSQSSFDGCPSATRASLSLLRRIAFPSSTVFMYVA